MTSERLRFSTNHSTAQLHYKTEQLAHMVFGAQVCSLVVELLQGIQVLADHSSMQVCRKLSLALQAIISMSVRQTDRLLHQLIGRKTDCLVVLLDD